MPPNAPTECKGTHTTTNSIKIQWLQPYVGSFLQNIKGDPTLYKYSIKLISNEEITVITKIH